MTRALMPDTPEVENWVRNHLSQQGLEIYPVEGYSVKDREVTALFERRVSAEDLNEWSAEAVEDWFREEEDVTPWLARIKLANRIHVDLFLILWQKNHDVFKVLSISSSDNKTLDFEDVNWFESCAKLAQWLGEFKGIPVTKRFEEPGRLSSIDTCLRAHSVPWPGNLDGFLMDANDEEVKAIFEFSRTSKYPVRSHDVNPYFSKDVNRWKPPDILSEELRVPLYVVIWSSSEDIVKLLKVREVGQRSLIYESEEILGREDLFERFDRIRD